MQRLRPHEGGASHNAIYRPVRRSHLGHCLCSSRSPEKCHWLVKNYNFAHRVHQCNTEYTAFPVTCETESRQRSNEGRGYAGRAGRHVLAYPLVYGTHWDDSGVVGQEIPGCHMTGLVLCASDIQRQLNRALGAKIVTDAVLQSFYNILHPVCILLTVSESHISDQAPV